jgi:mannose-6-phosphate isomerase-like protein (cupin superfamily)
MASRKLPYGRTTRTEHLDISDHVVRFFSSVLLDAHRHRGSDEILLFQNARARVSLGDTVREVHGGATVFIPANTWIYVTNIGTDAISAIFIFSAPGFEELMRAEPVSEVDKLIPLSKAQDSEIFKKHTHAVIYREPQLIPVH